MKDIVVEKKRMPTSNVGGNKFLNTIAGCHMIISKDFKRNKYLYLLALPAIIYYIVYHYIPMYGATIAFKNFQPQLGIDGSPWVGFKHFVNFGKSYYFWRILKNTLLINIYSLFWGFPAPIILALLLNEIKSTKFKRTIQTVTYLPHFVSIMVISGLIIDFTSQNGLVNDFISYLGGERGNLLLRPELFRTIIISTDIWQGVGWGSIIYLAALSGVDVSLYEAAKIDGAGRWKQMINVTLPCIAPTIIIMLILRLGSLMNVGFEKIILLYNETTYETADVISTFVYRKGLLQADFSYSAAVGLFVSIINFIMLTMSNKVSKAVNETSLW